MTNMVFNYAEIRALAGEWQAAIGRLQQILDEQKAEIAKLAANWTGETGDAFRREQKAWQAKADAFLAAATKLGSALSAAADAMAKTEGGIANNPEFSGAK
ncbi:WXG100 family type VII secretion target [Mycobacteroides franklinii]|uniref:WXG100 family type VII secretion target n=1 Tax=Mycobacteroides franklinii TaxID=948102 RepID=UPI0009925753|nr:WXG100 family type VII secretion target [Mycobacteroides franklinii]